MKALLAIIVKDLRLFRVDRRAVLMQIAAPVLISAFFGFTLARSTSNSAPAKIGVILVDQDESAVSRGIAGGLAAEAILGVRSATAEAAREDVRRGKAAVAIVLPAGFGAAAGQALLGAGAKPATSLLYDPSHAPELALVRGLLIQHAMASIARRAGGAATEWRPPYEVHEEAVTAQAAVPYNGFAHAFAGMSVQFILFSGINMGVGILLDKQRGLWKRVRAAPLTRRLVLGAKVASGALIAFITLSIVFAFAIALFGVRIEGSVIGFVGVLLAIAIMASAFGLLVATLGKTPEATRGISIFAVLIMVMLGGAWVPTFVFPAWLQRATLWVPARWAVDGIEGTTWRGLDLGATLPTIGALLGFALLFGLIAVARFEWDEG